MEPPDLTLIHQRICENISTLNNFSSSREPGKYEIVIDLEINLLEYKNTTL